MVHLKMRLFAVTVFGLLFNPNANDDRFKFSLIPLFTFWLQVESYDAR